MKRVWPILLPLALWQAVALSGLVPSFILPDPRDVFVMLYAERSLLAWNMLVTLGEIAAGLVIGVILGAGFAIAMTLSERLLDNLRPSLVATQAIPVFVLAPILTLWLGYGPEPKIAMVVLLVFFPVCTAFLNGLQSTPRAVMDLAEITHATPWRRFRWLRLPHALPQLGAGLRIGVTYAPTGAVIGEWIGASQGLGYIMLMANARMRIELMFAALILIVAMTILLNLTAGWLLKRSRM